MPAMIIPSISTYGSLSMTSRSENVPESPSSALQTMYFWSLSAPRAVRHLMGGERCAAASAQPDYWRFAGGIAVHVERLPQSFDAAVRDVVVDRKWVRDADARERQALLLLQIRQFVDHADILIAAPSMNPV